MSLVLQSKDELKDSSKITVLRDRGHMLGKAREFYKKKGILEVDCPILTSKASIDPHIDLIKASTHGQTRFLHSSPEYGMKRLLALGIGDIYQLSHVFREGEVGVKHNPEFLMAEWYRVGVTFEEMIHETVEFILLFLDEMISTEQLSKSDFSTFNYYEEITYRDAFLKFTNIDYLNASNTDLINYLIEKEIDVSEDLIDEGKEALLNLILALFIEPYLGKDRLTVLTNYPSSQAALAKTYWKDAEHIAERFEIYYHGVELANGYHELADANEQRLRLMKANKQREEMGTGSLPIDEFFLEALEKGLPECCGVAVGMDRLMMLRHQKEHISEVIPFGWDEN